MCESTEGWLDVIHCTRNCMMRDMKYMRICAKACWRIMFRQRTFSKWILCLTLYVDLSLQHNANDD